MRSGCLELVCYGLEVLPARGRDPAQASPRPRRSPRSRAIGIRSSKAPLPDYSLPADAHELVDSLEALAGMREAILGFGAGADGAGEPCAFALEHAYPALADRGCTTTEEGDAKGPSRGKSIASERCDYDAVHAGGTHSNGSTTSIHAQPPAASSGEGASPFRDRVRPLVEQHGGQVEAVAQSAPAEAQEGDFGQPQGVHTARGFGSVAAAELDEVSATEQLSGNPGEPVPGVDLPEWWPAHPAVVGIDAEWEPGTRDAPPGNVSLLQIATRRRVYLLDLLWFCGDSSCSGGQGRSDRETADRADGGHAQILSALRPASGSPAGTDADVCPDRSPEASLSSPGSGGCACGNLSQRERALSAFLGDLLGASHVVKAGFGLAYDLRRLAESYPCLPCFGGGRGGPAALVRSHVDVLKLARAVSPTHQQARLALWG